MKAIGGNSGYVGYSMSVRAMEAKDNGRYPKTQFKKEYTINDKTLNVLVDLGIIDNTEWHHTSKYGNRTTFYSWVNKYAFECFELYKTFIKVFIKVNDFRTITKLFDDFIEEKEKEEAELYESKMLLLQEYKLYVDSCWQRFLITNEVLCSNGVKIITNNSRNSFDWTAYYNGERLSKRHCKGLRNNAFSELQNAINQYKETKILDFEEWKKVYKKN